MLNYVNFVMYWNWMECPLHMQWKRRKNVEKHEKCGCVKLWTTLWKVWITICSNRLLITLCELVEKMCDPSKEKEKRWKTAWEGIFCWFLTKGGQNWMRLRAENPVESGILCTRSFARKWRWLRVVLFTKKEKWKGETYALTRSKKYAKIAPVFRKKTLV